MSPEPTQEPAEQNLSTHNLPVNPRLINDSDSEDEDVGMNGYVPLSQIPADSDPMLDEEEDDEWMSNVGEHSQTISVPPLESRGQYCSETIDVWSSSHNRSNIDMDADKINRVKSVMASITLPNTAIPEWASSISEDQWKEKLMGRIKEMQNKEK